MCGDGWDKLEYAIYRIFKYNIIILLSIMLLYMCYHEI